MALQEALEEQSRIDSQQPGWRSVLELDGGCAQARRQAAIIAAFDLPRDTKELLSLFLHCDANAEVEAEGVLVYAPEKIMKTAWRSKATMAYRQLELVESKDAGVIETLEKYRPRYGASSNDIEKTEKARHRKKRLGKRLVKGSIAAAIVLFFIIPAVSCVSMFIGAAKDMQGQRDAVIRDRGQVDDEVARLSALQEKIRSDIDSGNLASAQSSLPQLRYAIPKAVLEGDAEYQRRVERYDDMRMEYRELIAELESGDPPAAGPATHQE